MSHPTFFQTSERHFYPFFSYFSRNLIAFTVFFSFFTVIKIWSYSWLFASNKVKKSIRFFTSVQLFCHLNSSQISIFSSFLCTWWLFPAPFISHVFTLVKSTKDVPSFLNFFQIIIDGYACVYNIYAVSYVKDVTHLYTAHLNNIYKTPKYVLYLQVQQ